MNGEKIRAFIAIEMPDEVVREIARIQEAIGNVRFVGKSTELDNLHLTLKFLGEIDASIIERVKDKLNEIKFGMFEAKLSEAGMFNYKGHPRIIWVKIGGKGIFELQKKVDEMLKEMFVPEERFMSHMTIARVKYIKDKDRLIGYVRNLGVRGIKWEVDGFYLKKSELSKNGPVYTNLASFSLS